MNRLHLQNIFMVNMLRKSQLIPLKLLYNIIDKLLRWLKYEKNCCIKMF